jgi:hypothetical protein
MARLAASSVKLGAWLPELVREALAAELGKPVKVPHKLVQQAVASDRVRDNVRVMMQEAIKDVVERAFKSTPGGGGVKGIIGLGARATRGVFGGIADEVQRGLADRINDVIDSGVALVQRRIVEKMTSAETARQLGERRKQAFLKLLEQDEPAVAKFFSRAPWTMLDALFPAVAAHNLVREEVRKHLRDEVAIVLAELSTQPLGEVLDELGLRDLVRQSLHRHLPSLIQDFVATPAFTAWRATL